MASLRIGSPSAPRRSRRIARAALWVALAVPVAGWAAEPAAMSVVAKRAECSPPGPTLARVYAETGLDEQVLVCPGAGDTSLVIVSADEGSWVDVLRPVSTEAAVIYDLRPGNFPTVATREAGGAVALDVEWILDDKQRPTALVFPVDAMDPEGAGQTSAQRRYFVVRLPSTNACVLGAVGSVDEARALATSAVPCAGAAAE